MLLFAGLLFGACEPGEHHHHHQDGAHVHGVVRLSVAIDGEKQLGVELHAPAESIYGFEHSARSGEDQARQTQALERLKKDFAALLGLDAQAGCRIASSVVEVHGEDDHDGGHDHGEDHGHHHDDDHDKAVSGEHSEVHVEYVYECERAISETELRPTLHAAFGGIQTIQVQILGDNRQESSVITRAGAEDARIQL
ncbi:MAG: DUF2796 domain-containing protein [bacterium]|nr:DUF2796 domain-containing protein [bacterium]